MARDYIQLLNISERMQAYQGYIDGAEGQRRDAEQKMFNEQVKVIVYRGLKDKERRGILAAEVEADLKRIAATGRYSAEAIADARGSLLAEIEEQSQLGDRARFLRYWLPLAGAALLIVGYIYLKSQQYAG